MRRSLIYIIALPFILAALIATLLYSAKRESVSCMGVPILSKAEYDEIKSFSDRDVCELILLNGAPAAVDQNMRTIYVPQNITENSTSHDFAGILSMVGIRYQLFFAPDEAFDNIKKAVAENHGFTLLVNSVDGEWIKYRVFFTTLPVVRMYTQGGRDENDETVYMGSFRLWTASSEGLQRYELKQSNAEWHERGRTTRYSAKPPWKITLINKRGENSELALLGLGSDDDWILNPMIYDDLKIREKVGMDLWNTMRTNGQLAMSSGEYVEFLLDGKYYGLYLLERRIDGKYLQLDETKDMVFKAKIEGMHLWQENQEGRSIADAFRIITAPAGDDSAYRELQPYADMLLDEDAAQGVAMIDLDDWIDYCLFLQLGNMYDNCNLKNTYYVIQFQNGEKALRFIPWDTDMSFGVIWEDNGFALVPESAVDGFIANRSESGALKEAYPNLDERIAVRWKELRKTSFSEENLAAMFKDYYSAVVSSGAIARDQEIWEQQYDGKDTLKAMLEFITNQLERLDAYYGVQISFVS